MKVCILGMGKSGQGAARFLIEKGHEVVGWDEIPFQMEGVRVFSKVEDFDLIVISPGISPSHPLTQLNCEVIGEAELAFRYMKNRCIGVTGTNGKTTLTLLITHVLNQRGIPACALGNIGRSLTEYLINGNPEEVVIAELSSFQLETMITPAFEYGVILNITPDHLDRYPSFEAYAKVKCQLGALVKKELMLPEKVSQEFEGLFHEGNRKIVNMDSYLQLSENDRYWQLIGRDKTMCAFAICEKFGVSWPEFKEACKTFQRPEHRLEYVDEIEHVRFYNDSKGTNVDAVLFAISLLEERICLIAGGMSKNASFKKWQKVLPTKVKTIFAIGETADQIQEELNSSIPVQCVKGLQEAVQQAFKEANKGEIVLLSPGCASFDQFANYEERGKIFKECVFELKKGKSVHE